MAGIDAGYPLRVEDQEEKSTFEKATSRHPD